MNLLNLALRPRRASQTIQFRNRLQHSRQRQLTRFVAETDMWAGRTSGEQ